MALLHSPKIITDGLVLYYDMANDKKSFIGAPTTNLVTYPYADWTGSAFSTAYLHDATSSHTFTYVTDVYNPINSPGVMRYFTGTTGYKFWSLRVTGLTAGTYTFSYYARISKGPSNSNNLGLAQLWRDSDVTDRTPTGDWNPTFTGDWRRYTVTSIITGTYFDMFIFHSGTLTGGYTIDLCGFQFELSSVPTTFVAGTRSNTQSIIDLTGQNTLIANNLVYNTNNTFSFINTNTSYVGGTANKTLSFTTGGSMEMVFQCPDFTTRVQGYMQFVGTSSQGGTGYIDLLGNGNGRMRWEVIGNLSASGATSIQNNTNLSNNTWHHIVGTFTNTGLTTIYINGQADGSTQLTNWPTGTITGTPYIGNYFAAASGSIPVAKIYNTCLTAEQVSQNFNALRGRYGL